MRSIVKCATWWILHLKILYSTAVRQVLYAPNLLYSRSCFWPNQSSSVFLWKTNHLRSPTFKTLYDTQLAVLHVHRALNSTPRGATHSNQINHVSLYFLHPNRVCSSLKFALSRSIAPRTPIPHLSFARDLDFSLN